MQYIQRGRQYTFDGFEVTKFNSKAFDAAKKFAENADSKPLALFGGTATGKTHLLYAVKNAIEQNSPDLHVILTTTADMVSSLTNIISNSGSAEQFREKYLQADVLLVDDIQELAGKEKTQDELILLFNMFYESGRRFMMTSSQKESHFGIKARLLIRSFDGFYCNGVLYIPLPHHAGTSDYIEITIDEFDKEFLRFCEEYQE